ncbi:MAG TPA: HAMP domain-containing sensor histidine kinase [Chloroflexia bacterium]|nr:HAMP domain-containing sensor histidine kinase [Chloroflexia bacterium]
MKWSRFGLREKILATHLLVAGVCTVVLLALLILASLVFTTWTSEGVPVLPALAVSAIVAFAGVATAIVTARWLYLQITAPLDRASSLVQRLAKGEYGQRGSDKTPNISQAPPSHNADLEGLVAALDDLSLSLDAAERRRMEAFDEITHELRTPIAILEGYFEGLLDGHVEASDKTWAMLYDVASRVHRLVDTLRVLSRAEARREPPDLQSVAPDALAHAALDRMRLHFDEKGLELVADLPTNLPHVLADPDYTIQVLVNLLTNALRYTPMPGKVTVAVNSPTIAEGASIAPGAGEVVFSVTDTGVGIAAEHIPYLFERFFRVDRTSSHAADGSGIGLPVAKLLVEAMGGQIWAQSPGLGHGTTFFFTLLSVPEPARA